MENLKNTRSATKWVAAGILVKQGLRLVSNLIMTRILSPEVFGIMAIINLVIQALNMISDIGLRPSIIRSPRSDDVYLRTAWTIQVVRGMVLWLFTILVAWPISQYYEEPVLLYILPCSGLIALFMGFNSIAVIQNQKKLKYKKIAILDVISALIGLIVMVVCGIIYHSVWSLVLGGILSTLFMTIFSFYFLDKFKHSFCWNKEVVYELFHFGKWVFISTVLTFFVAQYDKLALGKLADMSSLGLYSIAMVWAQLPVMIFSQLNNKILYPVVAEYNRTGEFKKCAAIRNSIVKLSMVICIFMVAAGQLIVEVLYERNYSEAGDLVSILGILAWFQIVESINTNLLMAVGRPKDKIPSQVMGLVVLVGFMGVVYLNYGMYGVAVLAAASMMVRAYILDLQLRKDQVYFLMFDIKKTLILIGVGLGLHWLIDSSLVNLSNIIVLTLACVLTTLFLVYIFLKQTQLKRLMNV